MSHRSDAPNFSELRMTRWHRGLKEHRKNGETDYQGNPPEVEALEELTDLNNYLQLMSKGWTNAVLKQREGHVMQIVVDTRRAYDVIAQWALTDGIDMGSLWGDEDANTNEERGGTK